MSENVITTSATWPDGTVASAVFDHTSTYRYLLSRRWRRITDGGAVTFVMLNPSTADALGNDPTVSRCTGYAKRWGFASLEVVNLFALRATDPRELKRTFDPTGGEANDRYIEESCARSGLIVVAWGGHGALKNRAGVVKQLLRPFADKVKCLGRTIFGEPRHPLYLASNLELRPFEVTA